MHREASHFTHGDGIDAEIEEDLKVEDIDDACTVFEINYMTNIAPQLHNSLNGSGGPWYKVETLVREQAKDGEEFYVLAGTIFGNAPIKTVGNPNDSRPDTIGVPHMFWKVIVSDGHAFGFLFEHDAQLHPDNLGCPLKETNVQHCLVPIPEIEALAGIRLFSAFESDGLATPVDVGSVLVHAQSLFND